MNQAQSARRMTAKSPIRSLVKLGCVAALLLTAACDQGYGPSVPQQPGRDLADAKAAFAVCAPQGPKGASENLVGSYIFSVLWGGLLIGPVTVAASADQVRENGARRAIDDCLSEQGYERRELTLEEVQFLNSSDTYVRQLFLNHLIAGGTLAGFKSEISPS